ncbi:MAG: RES family NAD+ phosphorylase [Anaerolineales bacterium]
MSIVVWRIVKRKYEATAFDGEGASDYGGRWNSPGKRVIYTAGSKSLALLEQLVHLDSSALSSYVVIPVTFSDALLSEVDILLLPPDWKGHPAPVELRDIGDRWLDSFGSAVLRVPSAIVPDESNYMINPDHPDFSSVEIGASVPFEIDLRLLR